MFIMHGFCLSWEPNKNKILFSFLWYNLHLAGKISLGWSKERATKSRFFWVKGIMHREVSSLLQVCFAHFTSSLEMITPLHFPSGAEQLGQALLQESKQSQKLTMKTRQAAAGLSQTKRQSHHTWARQAEKI